MTDRMDKISDLALDLGAFELDNELETGVELSQRLEVEIHQKAPYAAKSERPQDVAARVVRLVLI